MNSQKKQVIPKNWIVATGILMLGVGATVTVPAFATTADNSTGDSSMENQNRDSTQSSGDKEKQFVDEIRECFSKAKSDSEFSSGTEKCMNDVLDKYFVGASRSGDKDESRNENTDKDEN
jgi:hypothetical protein